MNRRLVDPETGEIIDDVVRVVTDTQQGKIGRYRKLQQQRKELRDIIAEQCGEFYFYRYDKLLNQLGDDTATGFRFLYLCACANQEGYCERSHEVYCNTKEDFIDIFDVPKRTAIKYIDDLLNNKLIYKDNIGYKLNPMFYSMGNLNNDFRRNTIRTFNKAIRELYYNSDPREHKTIGKILKLVPYINIYNNILCFNINETDNKLIEPLTLKDILYILNNNNYSYTVMDKINDLWIKGEPVIGCFNSVGQKQFIVNPRLFYRGNNAHDLQAIIDQFDISKYSYIRKNKKKAMKKRPTGGEN